VCWRYVCVSFVCEFSGSVFLLSAVHAGSIYSY
jgi:hypothetical protein